ncbi:MAG: CPBP family intramembrane glutamic endopeptidase [Planctomycetota bacterium]|jgi:membrane protease YdiL (CAAX protease family)
MHYLFLVSLIPLLGALIYFVAPVGSVAPVIYVVVKLTMVVLPLLGRRHRRPLGEPTALWGWRTSLVAAVLPALGIMALAWWGPLWPVALGAREQIVAKVDQFGVAEHYWLMALAISLFHSAFEEYYWRWFVYRGWASHVSSGRALLIAGLAFGLHHYVVTITYFGWAWGLIAGSLVAVAGAYWCWCYRRGGHLGWVWLSHVLADLAIMAVGWRVLSA